MVKMTTMQMRCAVGPMAQWPNGTLSLTRARSNFLSCFKLRGDDEIRSNRAKPKRLGNQSAITF
jgi:hypothetical protein